VAGDFVGEAGVYFAHAGHGGVEVGVAFGMALFEVAEAFDPAAGASGGWAVDGVVEREAQAFDGDEFADAVRVDAGVA